MTSGAIAGFLFIAGAVAYVAIGSAVYARLHEKLGWKRAREIHQWSCSRKYYSCGAHGQFEYRSRNHRNLWTENCKECQELGFQHCHPCLGERAIQKRETFVVITAIFWLLALPVFVGLRLGKPKITRGVRLQLRITEKERAAGMDVLEP